VLVGEPAPARPRVEERGDGIYVVSGTTSGEAVGLTDEQLDDLRAMLGRRSPETVRSTA